MPTNKHPLKVFLCHASDDKADVKALYDRLIADGVDAWLDKEKLLPGQDWRYEIQKAVRESDVVIVCHSKSFNQEGFRQREVRWALDIAMEKPEGEIFIIPARLEECDVLDSLKERHWVDLFEENGYEKLMMALQVRASSIDATLRIKKRKPQTKSSPTPKVEKSEQEKPKEAQSSSVDVGGNVSDSVVVVGNGNVINMGGKSDSENKQENKPAQIVCELTDELQDGIPYISINLASHENRLIKCYSYIKSLEINGDVRDDIKREIAKHTNRVSWSGGSDEGIGIKYIDPKGFGKINLVSLNAKDFIRNYMQFETAKGAQFKDKDGKLLPFGNYKVELGLSCAVDGVDFLEIPITVEFEYFEEHDPFDDGVIRGKSVRKKLQLLGKAPAEITQNSKTLKPDEQKAPSGSSDLEPSQKIKPKFDAKPTAQKARPKLKTEYIVALIGAAATILAGILGSPFIEKLFIPPPFAVSTETLMDPSATLSTNIPGSTVLSEASAVPKQTQSPIFIQKSVVPSTGTLDVSLSLVKISRTLPLTLNGVDNLSNNAIFVRSPNYEMVIIAPEDTIIAIGKHDDAVLVKTPDQYLGWVNREYIVGQLPDGLPDVVTCVSFGSFYGYAELPIPGNPPNPDLVGYPRVPYIVLAVNDELPMFVWIRLDENTEVWVSKAALNGYCVGDLTSLPTKSQ